MVRFENDKLVIEIQSHSPRQAVEHWLNLQSELLYLIRWMRQDNISRNFYTIPDFLDNLLLDYDEAIKMIV